MLALTALGYLRARSQWEAIARLFEHPRPMVVEAAARALVRIDADRAVPLIAPILLERTDWHPSRLVAILGRAGLEAAVPMVARMMDTSPPETMPRLVALIEECRSEALLPALRSLLERGTDDETTASCLHALGPMGDPASADLIRRALDHPTWFVRVQAVTALSRVARPRDVGDLVRLLGDPEWWVRHRAAGALTSLRFLTPQRLAAIRDTHPDRYARDALAAALAERRIG